MATVVPILTAPIAPPPASARIAAIPCDRRVVIALGIVGQQLAHDQPPVGRAGDDVGEGAAAVDREGPGGAHRGSGSIGAVDRKSAAAREPAGRGAALCLMAGPSPALPGKRKRRRGRARTPLRQWKNVLIDTWNDAGADNLSLVAAGVAFYVFLALVPLLTALLLSYGLFADPATVGEHMGALTAILPGGAARDRRRPASRHGRDGRTQDRRGADAGDRSSPSTARARPRARS